MLVSVVKKALQHLKQGKLAGTARVKGFRV